MRRIKVDDLSAGMRLPTVLLHGSGMELIARGTVLSEPLLAALHNNGVEEVVMPEQNEPVENVRRQLMLMPMQVDKFTPGQTLSFSVYDNRGKLLLEKGASIPATFAESLRRRNINEIFVRRSDRSLKLDQARNLQKEIDRHLKSSAGIAAEVAGLDDITLMPVAPGSLNESAVLAALEKEENTVVQPQGKPLEDELRLHEHLSLHTDEEKDSFLKLYHNALANMHQIFQRLERGTEVDGQAVRRVVQSEVAGLINNRELLLAAGSLTLGGENYLPSHAVAVGILSINVGTVMGFSKAQIMSLGYGALLHDVGMLRIPPPLYRKNACLTPTERKTVERHPAHGLDMLQRIRGLPEEVPFVVYQSHEREDGSGYPRNKRGTVIHTYAKIVAVADTYNAICSNRPFRGEKLPYKAMEEIVLLCGKRKFDAPVVKAFLRCNSMFPVGSCVELTDGSKGRVVAANQEDYMRPILSILINNAGEHLKDPLRVNLLDEKELRVARALSHDEIGLATPMEGF